MSKISPGELETDYVDVEYFESESKSANVSPRNSFVNLIKKNLPVLTGNKF